MILAIEIILQSQDLLILLTNLLVDETLLFFFLLRFLNLRNVEISIILVTINYKFLLIKN